MPRKLALVLAAVAAGTPLCAAAQSISYTDSSTRDKLEGRVDFRIGAPASLALNADMKLVGQHGETKVLPRVTSSWQALEFLDLKTVLDYGDLNAATSQPKVDTSVVLRSDGRFVDRVEATMQRAGSSTRQSLGLRFSELDTGFDVLNGDPLAFRADMSLQRSGALPTASSKLTSSWGLGSALTMQSVLQVGGDRIGGFERSALDTKLVYRSPFAFIDRFEGEVHEGQGVRRESLAVLLPELSRGEQHGSSFSLTGKALIREVLDAEGAETRSVGLETKLKGVLPPLLGGKNALSLQVERALGVPDEHRSSLAYDHAWSPGGASIGINLKMLRQADELEPSMDLHWLATF